jgi:hypothetical protein
MLMMKLYSSLTVKSLTGTSFVLVVDFQTTTVADVKAMVADRQGGVPANQHRLICCAKQQRELEDQNSLRHYDIVNRLVG